MKLPDGILDVILNESEKTMKTFSLNGFISLPVEDGGGECFINQNMISHILKANDDTENSYIFVMNNGNRILINNLTINQQDKFYQNLFISIVNQKGEVND